jgi:hypothetical protein
MPLFSMARLAGFLALASLACLLAACQQVKPSTQADKARSALNHRFGPSAEMDSVNTHGKSVCGWFEFRDQNNRREIGYFVFEDNKLLLAGDNFSPNVFEVAKRVCPNAPRPLVMPRSWIVS